MNRNWKLVAFLMILLILTAATTPALANDYNYTKEEVQEIENYILKLEKKLKLKNELINSLQNEKELLKKKNDNLNIVLKNERKGKKKEKLISFGQGVVFGSSMTALFFILR